MRRPLSSTIAAVIKEICGHQDYLQSIDVFRKNISESVDDPELAAEVDHLRNLSIQFSRLYSVLSVVNKAAIQAAQERLTITTTPFDSQAQPPPLFSSFMALAQLCARAVSDVFTHYRKLANITPQKLETQPPPPQKIHPDFTIFSPSVQCLAAQTDPRVWRAFPTGRYAEQITNGTSDKCLQRLLSFHLGINDEECVIRLFLRDILSAIDDAQATARFALRGGCQDAFSSSPGVLYGAGRDEDSCPSPSDSPGRHVSWSLK